MKVLTRLAMAAMTTMALAGCAQFSPQQVTFTPDIPAESVPEGNGTTLWIEVVDKRKSNEIGRRGGVYADSSTITPAGNLQQTLQQIAERVLDNAGYQRVDMSPEVELTLTLDELSYIVEDVDAARKEATAAARISVKAVKDGAIYNNSFRAQRSIETLRYPSTEENSDLLNYVFDAVLERAFADPGLESFLNK